MVSNICFFDSYLKKNDVYSLTKYYISTGLKPTSKLPNILMNSLFYQYRTGFEILGTLQPLQNTLCVRISSRKKQDICWKFVFLNRHFLEINIGVAGFFCWLVEHPIPTQYIYWVHQKVNPCGYIITFRESLSTP